ncbi:DUF4834 family protein [Leeuwenhoekiella sp. A16]|uniref:DUF4834 family protein n=1 Tax=unclassified Leeuwenhoekiella TaxID=2615029 RepID=UPI003A8083D9|tara:strand:+ start:4434 stop:4697 length:264 start_codon:yes stop_codon:yes gene_type:complete
MEFLRTILIILLVIFGIRIIFRFAAPYVMRFLAKKAGERFQKMAQDFSTNTRTQTEPEGQTTIHKVPNRHEQSNKKVGEYIDYEEID